MLRTGLARSTASFAQSRRSLSVLVLGEHAGDKLTPGTLSAVTAAVELKSGPVSLLLTGSGSEKAAASAGKVKGVDAVLHASSADYDHGIAETSAALVAELTKANKFTHVLAVATNEGKNILPRVGALLDVQPISEVTKIVSADTFVRPTYAGNAIATMQSTDPIKLLTVRPTGFAKAATEGGAGAAPVTATCAELPAAEKRATWKADQVVASDRPELTSANKVVSGGRGLKSKENFKLVYDFADKLGAAVGASRAAVDSGYCPNEMQVGQTGKVVAPELYIAVGISGAIQHVAGMKDAKTIVCVNKDPEAPIFQIADVGLEGDLFTVLPEVMKKL